VVAVIALVGIVLWLQRDRLASNLIDEIVAANGLEADYDIVSVSPGRYVIANLVVGSTQTPDLTAEKVTVELAFSGVQPRISSIALDRPMVSARLVDQRISLGSLDPLIYADNQEPFAWPKINLAITDGVAEISSDFGTIDVHLNGEGRLDNGFAAELSSTTNDFGTIDCMSRAASLTGIIRIEAGRPSLDGDINVRLLRCAGAELDDARLATSATLAQDLGGLEASIGLTTGRAAYLATTINRLNGRLAISLQATEAGDAMLGVTHSLRGDQVATEYGTLGKVALAGELLLSEGFSQAEWRSHVTGSEASLEPTFFAHLSDLRAATDGVFLAPLIAQLDSSIREVLELGELHAQIALRSDSTGLSLDVPQAQWLAMGKEPVVALSRLVFERPEGEASGRLQGEIKSGGHGLPAINGSITQRRNGARLARFAMQDYQVGQDSFAIPRMQLRQSPNGSVRFDGVFAASGALPDGKIEQLIGPIEGAWSARTGVSIGHRCAKMNFAVLEYSGVLFDQNGLNLCPGNEGPMIQYRDRLELAITSEAIDLGGTMADAPARITATQANLAYPGGLEINGIKARFGDPGNIMHLTADRIEGHADERINGRVYGARAVSEALPFDLSDISGDWALTDGVLQFADGSLLLRDRTDSEAAKEPRFEPLSSSNARLVFDRGKLRAHADMFHASSGNLLAEVSVEHDLSSGDGQADFVIPGVTFTDALQPDDLSVVIQGVVADAEGTIDGKGVISWTAQTLESSGTFGTDDFDLAAAFGVVRGLRGEVTFSDLIALTTAPSQVVEIDSINPGVEALDGRIVYSITDGNLINIEDARWPFMGGELLLQPIALDFGAGDGQDYVFELVGIDAGSFVSEMDLTNIGASGTFDGTLPIHFDAKGNGSVRGGLAIARAPGGNVSYVGELTYEDLGTMANYAFQSLRSLDYSQMSVELNGDLGGEIITNFLLDGVRQGEGASQNFVTRRLAKLPIRFKINVRSDNFSDLALIMRGLFVPSVFDNLAARRRLGIERPIVPLETTPSPTDTPGLSEQAPSQELPKLEEPVVQPPESDDPV